MKKSTKSLILAAAALVVATGTISAQTLNADIPFAFRVSGKVLPAGTYRIENTSRTGSPILVLRNADGNGAMALPTGSHDAAKDWRADGRPRLEFACAETCDLSQLWVGGNHDAYDLKRPKSTDLGTRIAVVVMRTDKAD
jgi:hypothetical protein